MADELTAELIPDSGAGATKEARWTGNHNRQALERASQWTIYSAAAAIPIHISPNDDGTGMVASGLVTTANVTRIPDPPACRSVLLSGVAAADPAPARFLVRHGI